MRREFVRFILVGILNTIFGYALFALFIYLHCHYSLAVLFSTVLGIMFNFKTIGALVFKSNDNRLIFRFTAVYLVTYLLNVAALKVLKGFFSMYMAGFVILMPIAVLSFLLQKKFVFVEKNIHAAD